MGRDRVCINCGVRKEATQDGMCSKCIKECLETYNTLADRMQFEMVQRFNRPPVLGGTISNSTGRKTPYKQYGAYAV